MFTKNYSGLLYYLLVAQSSIYTTHAQDVVCANGTDLSTQYAGKGSLYATGCTFNSLMKKIAAYHATSNATSYSKTPPGVVFGTGNTPPTVDDYTLSGSFISGLSTSNVTVAETTSKNDDGSMVFTYVYTINNSTGADITIGEIGIQTYANSSSYYINVLVERTVLDTPVTIAAGGVGQVTYTIRMNYPT